MNIATGRRHLLACVLACASLSACNLFDPFDSPTSDPQLLSAARACFDKGDYTCARENYAKLSSSYTDEKESELAFVAYTEAGVDMGVFVKAFASGGSGIGGAITSISNNIGSHAGVDTRSALFTAYQRTASITDTKLKGLVRFIGSVAIIADLLQEDAATVGNLKMTDIATGGSTCKSKTLATCVASVQCGKTTGKLVTGATAYTSLDSAGVSTAATATTGDMQLLVAAGKTIDIALTELGQTSNASVNSFFSNLSGASPVPGTPDSPCVRMLLLQEDIGA